MRTNIVHIGADELNYEIREIVEVAREIEKYGRQIYWENIGDPVAKGVKVPTWIKEAVARAVEEDAAYQYGPTQGLKKTREFLAAKRTQETGVKVSPEDIIFFNGLGDAISKIYTYLNRSARIIGPTPAYSTHSSAEAAHAGSSHITYTLRADRNWLPDMDELANKVRYNPHIAGILIINPDNPTGLVYPRRVLEKVVALAEEHDLFLISDEIYAELVYGKEKMVTLAEVCRQVPALALRGISKEMPWPGARCGWVEVYNRKEDSQFARFVQTVINAKMLEVCSTTLPQLVIPSVLGDKRYKSHLDERRAFLRNRAEEAYRILGGVKGVRAPKPDGAFYFTVVFEEGVFSPVATLPIDDERLREYVSKRAEGVTIDKRFAYYLMAATGICVVPLSGFNTSLRGFRMTLLEPDDGVFIKICRLLRDMIEVFKGNKT